MAGHEDTIVVNNLRPVRIPVHVLDAAGRSLPDSGVRFAWTAGDAISVSQLGEVACERPGDATVRAGLGRVTAVLHVRCRPVETLRFSGPIQLVVGETARMIPVTAYGPDNRPVTLLAGVVKAGDTSVIALDGLRVRPKRWGTSLLTVRVGDRAATTGVHVYAPATTLDDLAREPRLIAVPLRLAPGEMRRWSLPPGEWMLSMWPEEDDGRGPQLRIEGGKCGPLLGLSRRRFGCWMKDAASVIVYAPWRPGATPARTDTLAIKPAADWLERIRKAKKRTASNPHAL